MQCDVHHEAHASDEPDSTWTATYAKQVQTPGSGLVNDCITALFAS
jgi:hypothetical protein